jgi:PilZ domain
VTKGLCDYAHCTPLHKNGCYTSVQMSHPARATRLDTHRVRVGSADGILLNLSASGALVRLPRLLPVAADATLSFLADDQWLNVPCKVVRCTETEVHMDGAAWGRKEFETAVTFYDVTALVSLLDPGDQVDRLR